MWVLYYGANTYTKWWTLRVKVEEKTCYIR